MEFILLQPMCNLAEISKLTFDIKRGTIFHIEIYHISLYANSLFLKLFVHLLMMASFYDLPNIK